MTDELRAIARRVGHAALDASAALLRRRFRSPLSVEDKGGEGRFDPVTDADRAAEAAIREVLRRETPSFAIYGEEGGGPVPADTNRPTWVVDPIDGTRAFMTGFPTWGTLLGLQLGDEMLWGAMDQPYLGERYEGDGASARAGRRPLRTRTGRRLHEAVLYATTPDMFQGHDADRFAALASRVRLLRFGGDCYAYAMLAAGLVDLVVEADLLPYDIAPLVPVIRGAGGVVTTWEGESPLSGGRIVAAATPDLHTAARAALCSAP